uniref:DNAJ-containing protein X-domain domain-containing protein n=1 Tax=Haptolina brevifila TaxID=156173 RepID=A0A7S2ILU6_9EUKA|mmetsp:Transcript_68176/g.135117  ORF Transcript_68176/g.135117 Transcript_68176/m.135117 type:complete len:440 (+) Transcript_68176:518-1837(+)
MRLIRSRAPADEIAAAREVQASLQAMEDANLAAVGEAAVAMERQNVISCAAALEARIAPFVAAAVCGEEVDAVARALAATLFEEAIASEAEKLRRCSMGNQLLRTLGYAYVRQTQKVRGKQGAGAARLGGLYEGVLHGVHNVSEAARTVGSAALMASDAWRLAQDGRAEEATKKLSDEQRAQLEQRIKQRTMDLAWAVTRRAVERTTRAVVDQLLAREFAHEAGAEAGAEASAEFQARCDALLIIGRVFAGETPHETVDRAVDELAKLTSRATQARDNASSMAGSIARSLFDGLITSSKTAAQATAMATALATAPAAAPASALAVAPAVTASAATPAAAMLAAPAVAATAAFQQEPQHVPLGHDEHDHGCEGVRAHVPSEEQEVTVITPMSVSGGQLPSSHPTPAGADTQHEQRPREQSGAAPPPPPADIKGFFRAFIE